MKTTHLKILITNKTNTMKKTIISIAIILISINLHAQTEKDIFTYKGIVALFEKKIEYVYDVIKEDFLSEKNTYQRTLLFLSDKEIIIAGQKYLVQSQSTEKEYDKPSDTYFDFTEYECTTDDGVEYIIEVTKSKNIIYGVRIYFWDKNKNLNKVSYQH